MITFDDGKWIGFLYDANGQKLRKTTSAGLVQDYVSGIEYENGNLEAIYHEEGRAIPDGNSFEYQYALKDHLGNVRVMFQDDGTGTAEIIQENHFYSFGLQMNGQWNQQTNPEQNYLYNGKELNGDFGLNWSDYGARWYDAAIGRWNGCDLLAERYSSISPYVYVANMPTKAIDPDGRKIIITNDYRNTLTNLAKIAATNRGSRNIDALISRARKYSTESVFWSTSSGFRRSTGRIKFVGTAFRMYLEGGRHRSVYAMSHEIEHAYNSTSRRNLKSEEHDAVMAENNMRSIYGETSLRNKYTLPGKGSSRGVSNSLFFNDDPEKNNPDKEAISNFTELNDISAKNGDRYLGFSFTKNEGGKTTTNYMLSVRLESGEYHYAKYGNKKEYDEAIERTKQVQDE